MEEKIPFLKRFTKIIGISWPNGVWILVAIALFGILSFGGIWALHSMSWFGSMGEYLLLGLTIASTVALAILFFSTLMKRIKVLIVVTAILAALAFIVEALLPNDMQVFPPFTVPTIIGIAILFISLGIAFFEDRMPSSISRFLPMLYLFSALFSFAFTLLMSPLMLFGWILILFMGLGVLVYIPMITTVTCVILFVRNIKKTQNDCAPRERRTAFTVLFALLFIFLGYMGWFASQWVKCETVVRQTALHTETEMDPSEGLPLSLKTAQALPVNYASRLFLQPRDEFIGFFEHGRQFDPLAFFCSIFSKGRSLSEKDRADILKVLFHYSHADLERLWSGHSLSTSQIDSHVQLYPELGLSYTETTLQITGDKNTFRGEAIYTITLPEPGVATSLSLWIDGKEEPARLTFKSRARNAYNTIVGREQHDPSTLEWVDPFTLRLRIFPVTETNPRTVRFGIVAPLKSVQSGFIYRNISLEGPPEIHSRKSIYVDLFTTNRSIKLSSSGARIKEKIVSDGQVRQWKGSRDEKNWSLLMTGTSGISGSAAANRQIFTLIPSVYETKSLGDADIWIALTDGLSRKEWKKIIEKIFDHRPAGTEVTLVGTEIFHSTDKKKLLHYLSQADLPRFSLFPFQNLSLDKDILILTAGTPFSIPFSGLKGSPFFDNNQKYFSKKRHDIFFGILKGSLPAYFSEAAQFNRIRLAKESGQNLLAQIEDKKITVLQNRDGLLNMVGSGLSMALSPARSDTTQGIQKQDSLLARLAIYQEVLNGIGKNVITDDQTQTGLMHLAETAFVVSPVTSLIVLESEADYNRFGIDKNTSELGMSKKASVINMPGVLKSKDGVVPEPGEWVLILSLSFVLLFIFRRKLSGLIRIRIRK